VVLVGKAVGVQRSMRKGGTMQNIRSQLVALQEYPSNHGRGNKIVASVCVLSGAGVTGVSVDLGSIVSGNRK
jgi:hypothetical protein